MNPQPKPVKRSTLKRHKHQAKVENIANVRDCVEERDGEQCRLSRLLARFDAFGVRGMFQRLELAHLEARGMGGNPDLSRDTSENTILIAKGYHQGARSHHSGHLKIRPLTDRGSAGPCCFEFYEQLPTEAK